MSTRVLIIDPNIPFMVSIKQALEGTGEFEVSVSANGLAAQDALQQAAHEIAVIDFNVADMDIMELIAQVRQVQPDLRILLSYTHDEQAGRAAYLGAHAIIAKPYTARDLIVQLHRLIARRAPGQPPPPDTKQPPRSEEPPAAPFIELPPDPAPPSEADSVVPTDADLRRLAQTNYFGDEPDPADTDALREWQDIDRTGKLRKTDALGDLIEKHGWVEGDATPPFLEEIAPREDDTPTVPTQDLNGVRQFLATDEPVHDPTTFGEVLDALAQAPPRAGAPSPDDQAFHDLVNSLRTSSAPARRGTLEDLLASIGAGDAPSEGNLRPAEVSAPANPLDYVLDSIRREQPAPEPDPAMDAALGDATIGDVIGGLFDPSFESVLAALAGQQVEDDDFMEPTYFETDREPGMGIASGEAGRIGLDSFEGGDDMPDWLKRLEMPEPSAPGPSEPSLSEDDSSHYPATAALSAVSDEEQKAGFSLNELLSQIEQQLPPPRDQRPRLRPLPSWEQNASPEETEQLRQVFPADNEWEPSDIEEIFSAPPVRQSQSENWIERVEDELKPGALDPGLSEPVEPAADLAPDDHFDAGWDAFADETPGGEALPADFGHLLDYADEAEQAEGDEPDRMALELDLDEDLIEAAQRAEADTPTSAPPIEDEDTLATEITEAFYEGVRQTVYDWDDAADDRPALPAAPEWQTVPDSAREEEPAYADSWREAAQPPAYENYLGEAPAETAAHLLSVEPEPEPEPAPVMEDGEAARLAQIALQLTQFSLESSAQATVLTHQGDLIAEAGDLPRPALERLERAIETAWSTSPPDYDSLSRFVALPGIGEFLLFSMSVANGMALSMVFNANTPVRTIRRQARRLSESLALVPEPAEAPEPPAATTRPARPTDLRAPEGLHAAVTEQPVPVASRPHPDTPYAGYTVLWLPWDPRLEMGGTYAEALSGWIAGIAQERAWDIDALAIEDDYIEIALKVPQKHLPDTVIHTLFDETARRTAEHFPELIDGAGRLWANGYYVVTPPRDLSEREIGRFITYQRQAQTG